MERELREIDVLAGDLHLVHGGFAGRYFHHGLRIGEAPEIFRVELVLAGLERRGQAPSVARGFRNDLHLFGARFIEPERLVRPFDDRAQAGQRHRFVMNLNLTHVDEALDESAQPVLVQIDVAARHRARLYLCPCGSISLDELITAWMLRANSIAPPTSMSKAARASSLQPTRAGRGAAMICLHSASTAASSSAAGTTSLTMPASRARSGPITAVDHTR